MLTGKALLQPKGTGTRVTFRHILVYTVVTTLKEETAITLTEDTRHTMTAAEVLPSVGKFVKTFILGLRTILFLTRVVKKTRIKVLGPHTQES